MTIADRKTPETDDLEIVNEIIWYGKNLVPMSERSDGKTWRESFNDSVGELADFTRRLERERDAAVEALRDVVDPIGAIKRTMQAGCVLNGQMAMQLSNDPEYLKGIARATLRAIKEGK